MAALLYSVFQGSPVTGLALAQPTTVLQLTLDSDPRGTVVWIILADTAGHDATMTGTFNLQVKEPDGATWTGARSVTPADFTRVPPPSILAGRTGYQVLIPSSAWILPPRRGATTALTVVVTRDDGVSFTSTSSVPFP